jgi:hypothetical protein
MGMQSGAPEISNKVHTAHKQLSCSKSDSISALNALLAYEATPSSEQSHFCTSYYLHSGHLREAAALHRQLHHILHTSFSKSSAQAPGKRTREEGALQYLEECLAGAGGEWDSLGRPKKKQIDVLCRCLLAGWPDHAARRIQSRSHIAASVRCTFLTDILPSCYAPDDINGGHYQTFA